MTRAGILMLLVACAPDVDAPMGEGTSGASSTSDESVQELASRIIDAACRKREDCSCEADASSPSDWCEAQQRYFETSLTKALTEEGRTFSLECFEQRIAAIDALGCDEVEAFPLDWETRACPISEEPTPESDCRTPNLGLWPCGASQLCDQGGCFGPDCEAVGTACEDAEAVLDRAQGERCAYPVQTQEPICGEGLVCGSHDTCEVGLPLGEVCPAGESGAMCSDGYCGCDDGSPLPCPGGSDGICAPFLPLGSDCETDEQCRPGRCHRELNPSMEWVGTCAPPVPLICDADRFASF